MRALARIRWGWIAIAAFVVTAIMTVAFASRFGKDPGLVASPLVGKPVPVVTLPYLEHSGSLALDQLRGEILVVNFWASWCLSCREEHPALVETAAAYEDSGVRFIGILYQDSRDAAISFLDEMGRGYDYVTDVSSRAAIEFGVFGVPETFFVDRNGVVVAKVYGPSTRPLLESTLDSIIVGETVDSHRNGPVQPGPGS
ncbi:MAG: redoxin domain-containing protein [Acidimicrobiia bacterium]